MHHPTLHFSTLSKHMHHHAPHPLTHTTLPFSPSLSHRYFLLHGAMVNYYDSIEAITATAQNKSSKGSPIVARVTHVRASQVTELTAEKASLAFQFESLEGKSFLVYAETAEEKLSWLTHLSNSLTPVGGVFKRRTAEDVYEKQIRAAEAALEESSAGAMVKCRWWWW